MSELETLTKDLRDPVTILRELATETLEIVGGDYEEAETRLRYLFRKDRDRWLDVLVDFTATQAMRSVIRRERNTIAHMAEPLPSPAARVPEPQPDHRGIRVPEPRPDRAARSLFDQFAKYLDWPLASGKRLRLATKADLLAEAERYRAQGRTMMARSDWMITLATKLGDAETVGEALSGKDVRDLHDEAEARWKDA